MNAKKKFWLLKSEPSAWSWSNQVKEKTTMWDGVRNYQASKNLKAMKKNDLCFFYHSGKEKRIIGIVRIIKEHFRDKTDKANKFVSVMVRGEDELSKPVTLKKIKNDKFFKELALVKQSRLSVMKINTKYWKKICKISNMA